MSAQETIVHDENGGLIVCMTKHHFGSVSVN